ncbi:alcohol dehydrogenase catalytic domain-containing protein [Limosilactobacillus balticus]|uniref:alcohol dehydrogenase catalytic domain-containing protein n=1 Tax=Limosilactobacillus balticus TaxID=2759747 RepID=UPI001E651501|nr:alcohol dehydrogenase catalytic domain-containing protein [Limosilactobacillus balticus]MCD7136954.1 alcohol dehydrogenase catalytic domain-containing protein [Limosilactobacillus balticus]
MKALVVEKAADRSLQDLNFVKVLVPTSAEHEGLIKVHSPVDYKIIEGVVSAWPYPHVLGLDVAGEIVSVGKEVTTWHVADRVSGHGDLTKNSCFAEYVIAPPYELVKIPASVFPVKSLPGIYVGL